VAERSEATPPMGDGGGRATPLWGEGGECELSNSPPEAVPIKRSLAAMDSSVELLSAEDSRRLEADDEGRDKGTRGGQESEAEPSGRLSIISLCT
jgi:hypothetical protein